ncbi:hypothetical protein [Brevundimonas aurantiaca]|jgi:hypothetical protein|uniref:hypothetical protein n=1 Tax=Brevundimonas aurantiaca TaxID=74316 RepID=UPI001D188220|nr:hypothetical protein [Brevundimonas aurantiaca]MCC4294704.1 hypothetical protein [Brevundimonas aurantiaca]
MTKLLKILSPSLLLIGGCASPIGPSRADLAGVLAISSSEIDRLRCHDIPEEPTEFGCRYRQRDAAGQWVRQDVMVAMDGATWVIIDGPGGG